MEHPAVYNCRMFSRSRKSRARTLVKGVCAGETRQVLNLLTDDFEFIDSRSVRVSGRKAFADVLNGLDRMNLDLKIKHDLVAVHGDEALMSGEQTSVDPLFNARMQWRVQFRGSKISEVQTYRGAGAPSIVRLVSAMQSDQIAEVKTPLQLFAAA